jgi:signal peptide peptidase SppA
MSKMREFRRALRSAAGKPLAYQIRDGLGATLAGHIEQIARGAKVTDAEITDLFARTDMVVMDGDEHEPKKISISAGPVIVPTGKNSKATAIVPMHGIALYDVEYQPYCFSTLLLAQTINSLASDPNIGTIILDIDTPGGAVTGTAEAADAIWAARQVKPVIGLINPLCCSAGLWLASQCTEIVAIPSADVGSLGVFMSHTDCSGFMEQQGLKVTYIFAGDYKVEGNPNEALSAEARAYYQSETDAIYKDFLAAVARGRGMDVAKVEETFGKGRSMMAPAAKKVGMIDRIASLDLALGKYGIVMGGTSESRRRGEAEAPEPAASAAAEDQPETPAEEVAPASSNDTQAAAARSRKLALLSAT